MYVKYIYIVLVRGDTGAAGPVSRTLSGGKICVECGNRPVPKCNVRVTTTDYSRVLDNQCEFLLPLSCQSTAVSLQLLWLFVFITEEIIVHLPIPLLT